MKKIFTLAAAGVLAAASLSAQAQVAVDGVLNTAEIGGTGGYILIGKFTMARGFGNAGLLSLYAATTATKVTFFLGGTVEPNGSTDATKNPNGNAFQLYFKTPAGAGVPAGTALPKGAVGTSFENMAAKMDMPVNLALAMHSTASVAPANSTYVIEGVSYTNATTVTSGVIATGVKGDGTVSTITSTTIPALVGARLAYKNTTNSGIDMNPGNTTPNTGASYGAAGSYGMEVEMDRAAVGLVGTAMLQVFALQNSGDGGYLSSDYIPQNTGPLPTGGTFSATNGNLQTNPDFSLVPGTQAATLNLSATGVTLGAKAAAAAAVGLSVYPNPVAGASTVSYQVADRATNVHIVLTDLLGRTVRTIENGLKPVGTQTAAVDASALAAGTYLVRVQVGDNVSTSKVSVL